MAPSNPLRGLLRGTPPGRDLVPERIAKQAIADAFAPMIRDMEPVKPWQWARPLSAEHWALLWIQGYKAGVFEVEYGVSCTWVPHLQGKTWRWHRTLKQSRRDLWINHFSADASSSPRISRLDGLDHVRRSAEIAQKAVTPAAMNWWESVDSPTGVLTEARRQEAQGAVTHWPPPELVTIFTLAKLGDVDQARQRLRGLSVVGADDRASLEQMLDKLR